MSTIFPSLRQKVMRRALNSNPRYSGCNICGDKWSWKKSHSFTIEENRSAFPICEECWLTASDEEIIEATMSLVNHWTSQWRTSEQFKDSVEDGEKLMKSVRENLRWRNVK